MEQTYRGLDFTCNNPLTSTPATDHYQQFRTQQQLDQAFALVDKYGGWISWEKDQKTGHLRPVPNLLGEPHLAPASAQTNVPAPRALTNHVEEQMEQISHITRIVHKQAAESYRNINREVSSFFLATEELENQAGDLSEIKRRELGLARLEHLQNLERMFREGQEIIHRYLREI